MTCSSMNASLSRRRLPWSLYFKILLDGPPARIGFLAMGFWLITYIRQTPSATGTHTGMLSLVLIFVCAIPVIINVFIQSRALPILRYGEHAVGTVISVDECGFGMTASIRFTARDGSVHTTTVSTESPKPEWRLFLQKQETENSWDLLDVERDIEVAVRNYARTPEGAELSAADISEPEPRVTDEAESPHEDIFYDPRNMDKSLVLTAQYPSARVDSSGRISDTRPLDALSPLAFPLGAIIGGIIFRSLGW